MTGPDKRKREKNGENEKQKRGDGMGEIAAPPTGRGWQCTQAKYDAAN